MRKIRCSFTVIAAGAIMLWTGMAAAKGPPFDPKSARGGIPQCKADLTLRDTNLTTCNGNLTTCNTDLGTCITDLAACETSAIVQQTGQTTCWDPADTVAPIDTISCAGTRQDGDVRAGVVPPVPRFTDNMDGTITDNMTGLVWLKDAICLGSATWANALATVNALADGTCGLTDGSSAGDWYLPNIRELFSLVDFQNESPALPSGHLFMNFVPTTYSSSTTIVSSPGFAWVVDFPTGRVTVVNKNFRPIVLPVRGGF